MAGYIGKQAVVLSTTAADVNGNADIDGDVTATGDFITDEGKVKAERVEVENDTGPNMYATAYGTGSTTYTWFEGTGDNKLISWGNNGDISFYDDDGSTVGLRWDASTNRLGIGTSSPRSSLDIDGGSGTQLRLQTDNTGTGTYDGLLLSLDSSSNAKGYLWNYENAELIFGTNNAERMRIDSSGNVGIGGTAPSNVKLYVNGNNDVSMDAGSSGQVSVRGNGYTGAIALDGTAMNIYHNSSSRGIVFGTNETERMRIDAYGKVGIGTTSPARLLTLSTTDYAPLLVKHTDGGGAYVSFMDNSTTDDTEVLAGAVGNNFVVHAGDVERMRIDSSGRVTMPYQPSAVVHWASNQYVAHTGGNPFVFTHTHTNIGSHYNTSNGRFTCPVAGRYLVTFYTLSSSNSDAYYLEIRKNNGIIHYSYQYTRSGHIAAIVNCNANDYLTIGSNASISFYHGANHSKGAFHLLG